MKLRYKVIRPVSHEAWLAERKNGIGASEAGIILGSSNFASPYQLWRNKLGLAEPIEETWPMKQGHIYESYIAKLFEEEMGYSVIKASVGDWIAVDNEKPFLRVSPDWTFWKGKRKTESNKGLLECKSSRHDYQPSCLSNECLSWFCQTQYQMYVLGYDTAYLGFICVENGNHWFEKIEYNEKFCKDVLVPALTKFWRENILPAKELIDGKELTNELVEEIDKFAPPITSADDVQYRYPVQDSEKTIDIADVKMDDDEDFIDALSLYSQLKEQRKVLEAQTKAFEDKVKLIMGDADSIIGSNGKPLITYRANKTGVKFDTHSFQIDCPDLYNKYCHETAGARILRIK